MRPVSDHLRNLASSLIAAALQAVPTTIALAQTEQPQSAAAASSAAPAEEPLSRRDRRRAAKASPAAQAPPAELPATQGEGAAPAEPAVENEEPEMVCKTIKPLGTKIGRRVCGTPEQWASSTRRSSDAARDAMNEIATRSGFPAAPEVPTAIP
jgi:hypothetical protein